jgi:hypothetical protein
MTRKSLKPACWTSFGRYSCSELKRLGAEFGRRRDALGLSSGIDCRGHGVQQIISVLPKKSPMIFWVATRDFPHLGGRHLEKNSLE